MEVNGHGIESFEEILAKQEREALRENKEFEKLDLGSKAVAKCNGTNASVEKTNNFIIGNITRQNRLTIVSIIVVGASVLFTLSSIYVSSNDTTDEEVKTLRLELQKQSQKGIDSF